ncbi:hypothetical protein Q5M87_04870 [Brachyspira innocens]|uniref:HEPN domain-containing protein n=1 Tax=Brachyspira innocens TaxID=13264 RepID=A0ABT8YUG5_9SPIR|nr:hypothetical protein [Brachyspira innocens]MDO6993337.1 hypothetical protein [Brachyspira innocens]MDO7019378.1 hypothetical protein [Brachyspira innocens]
MVSKKTIQQIIKCFLKDLNIIIDDKNNNNLIIENFNTYLKNIKKSNIVLSLDDLKTIKKELSDPAYYHLYNKNYSFYCDLRTFDTDEEKANEIINIIKRIIYKKKN